jgi:hypothetical protein
MQNKPNLLDAQMNVSSVKTMNYEQITMNNANKNKANQTQPNPITNGAKPPKISHFPQNSPSTQTRKKNAKKCKFYLTLSKECFTLCTI